MGLVVAGAAVVLGGAAGGWAITRTVGGQSPLTAQNVTTVSAPTQLDRDPLGFTIPVPVGWGRYPQAPANGLPSVSFVSSNGIEELTVAGAAKVADGQDVAGAEVLDPAVPASTGPAGTVTLSYQTDARRSWRMVVPSGGTAWVITLTVPRSAAGSASADLFDYLSGKFSPSAA
jgi:hypothetical protein